MDDVIITLAEGFENNDVYDVYSELHQESINITAQGMLEIAVWVKEHQAELEPDEPIDEAEAEYDAQISAEMSERLGFDINSKYLLRDYWLRAIADLQR